MWGHKHREATSRPWGEPAQSFCHFFDGEVLTNGEIGWREEWFRCRGLKCLKGRLNIARNREGLLRQNESSF